MRYVPPARSRRRWTQHRARVVTCKCGMRHTRSGIRTTRGSIRTISRKLHAHLFQGRKLRLGAYGDPCSVPYRVWKPLVDMSTGHTGYTHQWQDKRFWRFRSILMASVETPALADIARSRGWRYFRTMQDISQLGTGEILCPASKEAGKRRQCETCLACKGSNGNPPHGVHCHRCPW